MKTIQYFKEIEKKVELKFIIPTILTQIDILEIKVIIQIDII